MPILAWLIENLILACSVLFFVLSLLERRKNQAIADEVEELFCQVQSMNRDWLEAILLYQYGAVNEAIDLLRESTDRTK